MEWVVCVLFAETVQENKTASSVVWTGCSQVSAEVFTIRIGDIVVGHIHVHVWLSMLPYRILRLKGSSIILIKVS